MQKISKVLIAYDGSACSDAMIEDLKRAGLPASLNATVLTAADVFLPPPDDQCDGETASPLPGLRRHVRARAENVVRRAENLAQSAAKRVVAAFPDWIVQAEVRCDVPAWAVMVCLLGR